MEAKLREDASITLLVNNAGIGTHTPLLQSDVEHMAGMIALNVVAPTRLTYAAAPSTTPSDGFWRGGAPGARRASATPL